MQCPRSILWLLPLLSTCLLAAASGAQQPVAGGGAAAAPWSGDAGHRVLGPVTGGAFAARLRRGVAPGLRRVAFSPVAPSVATAGGEPEDLGVLGLLVPLSRHFSVFAEGRSGFAIELREDFGAGLGVGELGVLSAMGGLRLSF